MKCEQCGGLLEIGSGRAGLCPECSRANRLIWEQRRQQISINEQQGEIQRETHLNKIKLKMLEYAAEAIESPEKARLKVEVIMRSSDFVDNLSWFERDLLANLFLTDVYLSNVLKPVTSTEISNLDAIKFFDKLDISIRNSLQDWLAVQPVESIWQTHVMPLYQNYKKVLKRRQYKQNTKSINPRKSRSKSPKSEKHSSENPPVEYISQPPNVTTSDTGCLSCLLYFFLLIFVIVMVILLIGPIEEFCKTIFE